MKQFINRHALPIGLSALILIIAVEGWFMLSNTFPSFILYILILFTIIDIALTICSSSYKCENTAGKYSLIFNKLVQDFLFPFLIFILGLIIHPN